MLRDVLGREAEEFLAHRDHDYRVEIDHAGSSGYDWFYLRIYYRGNLIASWSCCRRYWLARRRIRRTIRSHRKLLMVSYAEGASA